MTLPARSKLARVMEEGQATATTTTSSAPRNAPTRQITPTIPWTRAPAAMDTVKIPMQENWLVSLLFLFPMVVQCDFLCIVVVLYV